MFLCGNNVVGHTKLTLWQLFQQAYGKIKKVGMTAREEHPKEAEMKRNIQSRLALELQDLSSDFKKAQQEYLGSTSAVATIQRVHLLAHSLRPGRHRQLVLTFVSQEYVV